MPFKLNRTQGTMNINIPVLTSDRLILREHTKADLEACIHMWKSPKVVKYTIGTPSSPQKTWVRMLTYLGHWRVMGYGYWAVTDRQTGNYIGELGFADFHREITPSINGIPELGWALAEEHHGKGYATEALKLALTWGKENLKTEKTVCIISPENTGSLKLADKLGFKAYATATKGSSPEILLERFF